MGLVKQGIRLALDAKRIIEGRFNVTSPKIFITEKCAMFLSNGVALLGTGGNPIIVSSIMPSARSIIKDI